VVAALVVAVGLSFVVRPRPAVEAPHSGGDTPKLAPGISAKSGEMVLVPAGTFLFGENKETATTPAFYIDKTEVTNSRYAIFCDETHHGLPPGFPQDKPDYPVVNVSILDAQQFAQWAGERLPSAKEWEKAARGSDGRLFPWGNEKDASRANVGSTHIRPATDFEEGKSPCGALNMVGNVWEFVYELSTPSQKSVEYFKSLLRPSPTANDPWYTVRGVSFQDQLFDKVIWDAATVPARWKDLNIGFRCVKDAQ